MIVERERNSSNSRCFDTYPAARSPWYACSCQRVGVGALHLSSRRPSSAHRSSTVVLLPHPVGPDSRSTLPLPTTTPPPWLPCSALRLGTRERSQSLTSATFFGATQRSFEALGACFSHHSLMSPTSCSSSSRALPALDRARSVALDRFNLVGLHFLEKSVQERSYNPKITAWALFSCPVWCECRKHHTREVGGGRDEDLASFFDHLYPPQLQRG